MRKWLILVLRKKMHKMRIEHSIVLESKEVPTEGKWKITGEEKKRKKKKLRWGYIKGARESTGRNANDKAESI